MNIQALPKSLVSLIHHVELSKAHWWDRGVQRLILAILHQAWLSDIVLAPNQVQQALRTQLHLDLEQQVLDKQITALEKQDFIVRLPNNGVKLTEQRLAQLNREIEETERLEIATRKIFQEALGTSTPGLDVEGAWEKFKGQFLLPLVHEAGANTYKLITGGRIDIDRRRFDQFLASFPDELHQALRSTLQRFLDLHRPELRAYILRHLTAYFFVEAAALSQSALAELSGLSSSKPSFTLFVDTNVLFSILELHENPSNEAARSLSQLVGELSSHMNAKLYVLECTVNELKHVLTREIEELRGLRITPNMAEATLRVGVTGVRQKLVEESRRTQSALDAEQFLSPYTKNLLAILRSKGVELYNERLDSYKSDPELIEDVLSQLEYEHKLDKKEPRKAKEYEQLEHDMTLWHFTRRKRSSKVESPLRANFWVVTVDFRFLNFDTFKRRLRMEEIPICIHPSILIQLMQFWVPRSERLEAAMLSSLFLPFLFREFDAEAERVTVQILRALGRYQDISDFEPSTISEILIDDVLRGKIAQEQNIDKHPELVRPYLTDVGDKIRRELAEARDEQQRLKQALGEKRKALTSVQEQLHSKIDELARTHERLSAGEAATTPLVDEIRELKREVENQKQQLARTAKQRKFALRCIGLFLATFLLPTAVLIVPSAIGSRWKISLFTWLLMLIMWVWFVDRRGTRDPEISSWVIFAWFHRLRIYVFIILGAVLGQGIASDAYLWLKDFFLE